MIPSTKALEVFAAVARFGGLRAAARELGLTQSSVSHQVAVLEQTLGKDLFERSGRSLILSEAGRDYLMRVEGPLLALRDATRQMSQSDFVRTVVISAPPSFLASWLTPRLRDLQDAFPRTDIVLVQGLTVDLQTLGVDLAIEYRREQAKNSDSVELMSDLPAVFAAPGYVVHADRLGPPNLDGLCVIETERRHSSWDQYFSSDQLEKCRRITVPFSHYAFEIARLGLGIALGNRMNALPYLERGELVEPWDLRVHSEDVPRYFATIPQLVERRARANKLRDWFAEKLGDMDQA